MENGLHLTDSVSNIHGAVVSNDSGFGISLGGIIDSDKPGSEASIFSSNVSGLEVGIAVGLWGELNWVNTELHGAAWGCVATWERSRGTFFWRKCFYYPA
ncbi:hypothetical protein ALQ30_200060 [Pseudomonas syringae pv. persicae]|uniref:Autotransporter n=1 Tax=Pseudomonas syringae pv. persicae TaxID=237306 RepID=A0A3M4B1W0_9PSED|nr:hypothetical protein ALQ30_200060 [Pseudomonas syringae pv. persicae]